MSSFQISHTITGAEVYRTWKFCVTYTHQLFQLGSKILICVKVGLYRKLISVREICGTINKALSEKFGLNFIVLYLLHFTIYRMTARHGFLAEIYIRICTWYHVGYVRDKSGNSENQWTLTAGIMELTALIIDQAKYDVGIRFNPFLNRRRRSRRRRRKRKKTTTATKEKILL